MAQVDISCVEMFVNGLDHPEGLAFAADGTLWAGGRAGQVYRIPAAGGQLQEIANTGGFCLGMAFDRSGNLFVCDTKLSAVVVVKLGGETSVLANGVRGRKLHNPNWLVFDSGGCLYVSDSGDQDKQTGMVYRFSRDGQGGVFAGPFSFANGLALDVDGSFLYVVESTANRVSRVRITPSGLSGECEVFAHDVASLPDGIAFDDSGTLYIACFQSNRIYTADRKGALSILVEDPNGVALNHPTNVAFGGRNYDELYIANLGGKHISRLRLGIRGQPLYGGPRPSTPPMGRTKPRSSGSLAD